MKINFKQLAIAVSLGATAFTATAEEVHNIGEINVKGEAMEQEAQPSTTKTLDAEQLDKIMVQRPEEVLEEVPGVNIGDYNQGGVANAISMRGFRAGAHGGDAAVFVDGVTLNESEGHSDGYADMNVIIPLELDHVDVHMGPSSALYGNFARSGTIAFTTKKGGEYNKLRVEQGSFKTLNTQFATGFKVSDKIHNNTAVQYFHTDGYQENSHWLRGNLSSRFGFDISEKLSLAISGRVHGSEWGGPGYIPDYQFENEETAFDQAIHAEKDGGSKRYYAGRFDLGYTVSDNAKLLAWLYVNHQEFTRFGKFSYAQTGQKENLHNRYGVGTGVSYNYMGTLGSIPLSAVAGIEYFQENTDHYQWKTFNRARYESLKNREFAIGTLSEFVQVDAKISPLFRPTVGLRLDQFFGDLEYNRTEMKTVKDTVVVGDSVKVFDKKVVAKAAGTVDEMNDYMGVSPKVGFSSLLLNTIDFRASYSQAYKLPRSADKYTTMGASVDPETIRQYEVGLNFNNEESVEIDVAGYIIDTENELNKKPDEEVYSNVGKTRRMGIDGSAKISPVKGLDVSAEVGAVTTEILENPSASMVGKEIPRIPEYTVNSKVRYETPSGFGVGLSYRHVGPIFIDSNNKYTYDGYGLLNSELFYAMKGKNGQKYRFYVNIDNLADTHYSQMMWQNKDEQDRDVINYAVGSPRKVTGGIQLEW